LIPYGRQHVAPADVDAVTEVLLSDWLTQGPAVERFESALANAVGAKSAVAVSSGTAALHLACRILDFGQGDELWTSPITFLSSANCALFCGGDVDFVDVDPNTFNLSPEALEAKLQTAKREGRLPKIVMPVHFAGLPCDMAAIHDLSQEYGFRIVEDASHALGAQAGGQPVGCCQYSDVAVFSFHPVKSITTGEGGALALNYEELAARATRLRSHGVERCPGMGGWYYEQTELGYNYRMTDIQAALGASQLNQLQTFIARRRELSERYDDKLQGLPLKRQRRGDDVHSAHHLYPIRLNGGDEVRRHVYDQLVASGIKPQVHYIPVHRQPFYQARGFREGDFPEAERYYTGALSLPLFPDLTEAQQDQVVAALKASLEA
jgi:UDP-4-amino-4,6-dideoxy-N-acetyl-beta-L-altrosamine transaminase